MQELYGSQDENGVLDGEGKPEPGTGSGGVAQTGSERMERHYRVGVRTGEESAGGNRIQSCKGDQGERRALQSEEGGKEGRKRKISARTGGKSRKSSHP